MPSGSNLAAESSREGQVHMLGHRSQVDSEIGTFVTAKFAPLIVCREQQHRLLSYRVRFNVV